jgi:flagellin-like protein
MKGVSPLIASVMLIAITVSMGMLIMGWFSNLSTSTTTTVSNKTTEAVACSSAKIAIDDVYITAGDIETGTARVIVKNGGFDDIGISSAQMYNRTGDNFSTGFEQKTIGPGNIYTIYISNVSVPSCPLDFSKVIVTTNCGGVYSVFDGSPKCT